MGDEERSQAAIFASKPVIRCDIEQAAYRLEWEHREEVPIEEIIKVSFRGRIAVNADCYKLVGRPCEVRLHYSKDASNLAPDELGLPVLGALEVWSGSSTYPEEFVAIHLVCDKSLLREAYETAKLAIAGDCRYLGVDVSLSDVSLDWDPLEEPRRKPWINCVSFSLTADVSKTKRADPLDS